MTKKVKSGKSIRKVDVYRPWHDLETVDLSSPEPLEPDDRDYWGWVEYCNNLETYNSDGDNITEGDSRYYQGIVNVNLGPDALTESEQYVLIYAVDDDEAHKRDYGVVVDPITAAYKIAMADKLNLLDTPEFCDLRQVAEDEGLIPRPSLALA